MPPFLFAEEAERKKPGAPKETPGLISIGTY
jgi:hypothetical protein